jgi:hypothetical protein
MTPSLTYQADAGGSISQLKILSEVMLNFSQEVEIGALHRPCTVFDIICGVGSGGQVECSTPLTNS